MRNPWLVPEYGKGVQTYSAEERLSKLKKMSAAQLRAAIAWPETQKTVRKAADARLRRLLKK
jgi:hypothetical protein